MTDKYLIPADRIRSIHVKDRIVIDYRDTDSYAIVDDYGRGAVMHCSGEWVYEPLPSSRTEQFIKETRYTFNQAILMARTLDPTFKVTME